MDFTIEDARQSDLGYLQKHVNQATRGLPRSRFWVARSTTAASPLGVVSLRILEDASNNFTGRFLVWVEEDARRKGIGKALMQHLEVIARQSNAGKLLAGKSIDSEDEQVGFFQAIGFEALRSRHTFKTETQNYRPVFDQKEIGIEQGGAEYDSATTISLKEASGQQISAAIQVLLSQLGGIEDHYRWSFNNPEEGYHPEVSFISLIDGQVGAALMSRVTEQGTVCEAFAAYPEFRKTRITHLLQERVVEFNKKHNIDYIWYEADTVLHPTTINLAKNVNGEVVSRKLMFGKILS